MKKTLLLSLLSLSLLAGKAIGQDPGWSSNDRKDFIVECVTAAQESMSVDSAKYYCYCMLEKVETRYPDPEEAGKLNESNFASPEWKAIIKSCLGGYWKRSERTEFMSSCIDAASANLGEEKAKAYCDCMMYKIEIRYSSYAEASKLTAETLGTPEWQKIIKSCLQ